MAAIATVAGVLALILCWSYFLRKSSGRTQWNPLWMAFTLTAVALLYGGGGLMGYVVARHNPFIGKAPRWVGHVVWTQVGWASATLLVSIPFWYYGLRRLSRETSRDAP